MAGLKELYKKRKDLLNKEALASANLARMQEEMALHAPYLHQMTYDLMPSHIKQEFEYLESLKNKGRNGDTEVRNIDGKPAHVTMPEASLLDSLGKAAIPSIKKRGAGTINPNTGLKEYHAVNGEYHYYGDGLIDGHGHYWDSRQGEYIEMNQEDLDDLGWDYPDEWTDPNDPNYVPPPPDPNEALQSQIEGLTGHDISTSDVEMYFGDIYTDEPKTFATQQAELTRKDLGLQQRAFQSKQAGQVRGIMSQENKMRSQSGFATSGAIDYATQQSRTNLAQDTQLGLDKFALSQSEIGIDLEKSLYDIGKAQDKEFYERLSLWDQGQ